jgi:hypothetical protein
LEEKKVAVANLEQARQGPGFAQAMPLQGMSKAEDDEEEDDDFGQVRILPGWIFMYCSMVTRIRIW